jgi:rod shape-determining protein MreC
MVTQVISTVNDPYSDQVVIDKGSVNGVYEGQPVISAVQPLPAAMTRISLRSTWIGKAWVASQMSSTRLVIVRLAAASG